MDKLQPMSAFVEEYMKDGEWLGKEEFLVHRSPSSRFRIIPESYQFDLSKNGFIDIWRDDTLMEAGVNVMCDDAREFAETLTNTLFFHCSPHEIFHVIQALNSYLEKWQELRMEHYRGNPEFWGGIPPEPLTSKHECFERFDRSQPDFQI